MSAESKCCLCVYAYAGKCMVVCVHVVTVIADER